MKLKWEIYNIEGRVGEELVAKYKRWKFDIEFFPIEDRFIDPNCSYVLGISELQDTDQGPRYVVLSAGSHVDLQSAKDAADKFIELH